MLVMVALGTGLAGCSSMPRLSPKADDAAMATANATERQLLELKRQVRLKQEAERKYYQASMQSLDDATARADYVEQRQAILERSHNDAKALIDKQGQADAGMLGGQILAAASEMVDRLNAAMALRKTRRAEMAKALAALDDLEADYSALERALVQLSTAGDQSAQLASFLIKAGQEFKKLQDQAKQPATTAPVK